MPRPTLIYCTLSLLLFALLSWFAASTKCATSDEPLHAAASYVALHDGDFRPNPEHPILWKYYAALPLVLFGPPLEPNLHSPVFHGIPGYLNQQWIWCIATVYRTDGNDPERFISQPRFMMLLLAISLGALLSFWAYRLAGPLAAVVAASLFSLDPNFLAHSSLMTNDVAITLLSTSLAYSLWRAGTSLPWPRLLLIALLSAFCVTTKYTGLLAGPIVLLTLSIRALLPTPWPVLGRSLSTRPRRLLAVLLISFFCFLFTFSFIWALYRFRFGISPDPSVHFDIPTVLADAADQSTRARFSTTQPTPAQLATWQPELPVRADLFALQHHLLPEAFLQGLLHAHSASRFRTFYLLGQVSHGGRWYYFPFAIAVKFPLTTLLSLLASLLFFSPRIFSSFILHPSSFSSFSSLYLSTCFLIPILCYGGSAVAAHMNIGIRHIFPIFPFLFLTISLAAARLHAARPRLARTLLPLLLLSLAAETLSAYPNYIPFFNIAAGGYQGGYHLLSDSNLDWGQDLPLLAQWQRNHPHRTLYLSYFGNADPWYYGIQYQNLPGGYEYGPPKLPSLPSTGVVAVSAMVLQGDWKSEQTRNLFSPLQSRPPTQILGGSLYLFDLDAPPPSSSTRTP